MKTTIEDSGDYVRVIVFDVDPALAPQMAGFEFTPIERGFERRFEAGPQDLPVIVARFQDSIEEMVMQLAGRKPTPWQAALRRFVTIAGTVIDWWLVGSTALAVRGIPIDPKDVDIVVPEEAFDRTNGLFNDFIVEPPRESSEFIARFFARAFMDARVEWVAGVYDWADSPDPSDFGPVATSQSEVVDWERVMVQVPPLQLQLDAARRRGLHDRVRVIEAFLDANT